MRYLFSDQLLRYFKQMCTFKYAFVQIMHKSNRQNFCCLDKGVIFIALLQFHVNIKQKESTVHWCNYCQISKPPLKNQLETQLLSLCFISLFFTLQFCKRQVLSSPQQPQKHDTVRMKHLLRKYTAPWELSCRLLGAANACNKSNSNRSFK